MERLSVKTCLSNFKSNIWLIASSLAIGGLCWSFVPRLNIFIGICLGCVLAASFCITNPVPLKRDAFTNKAAIITALLIESVMFLNFYDTFNHGKTQQFIVSLGLPSAWFWIAVGLMLCVIGLYAMYVLSLSVAQLLQPFVHIITKYQKMFLILAGIFCVGLIAIIRANCDYYDDMYRVGEGYQLTGAFSRYLSTFLSTFVHGDAWLAEISPLPQLLAACISAFTGIVLYACVTDNAKLSFWGIAAMIPVGLSPYFLQCLSYKYDSPYMALSVLFAVAPLAFFKRHTFEYVFMIIVGTIMMCTTYQASSGIFPMLVVLITLLMWIDKKSTKEIFEFAGWSAFGYVLGLLLFRFVLMQSFDNYIDSSISLKSIIPNIITFFQTIHSQFSIIWEVIIFILVVVFVIVVVEKSKRNKLITLLFACVALGLMLLLSFGVYVIFTKPMYSARAMYGFGVFISLVSIVIAAAKKHYVGKLGVFILSWMFLVFAFTYGNALNTHDDYTDFRIQQVISDIKDIEMINSEEDCYIQVTGSIGYVDHNSRLISEYPLLEELLPELFCDSSKYPGCDKLVMYYNLGDKIKHAEIDLTTLNLPILKDTVYHTIRGEGNYLLIELKE